MIIDTIGWYFVGSIALILQLMPTLPAMPEVITTSAAWLTSAVTDTVAVLNMIYTPELVTAIMVVVIAIFNFEYIYYPILWAVKKILLINVK